MFCRCPEKKKIVRGSMLARLDQGERDCGTKKLQQEERYLEQVGFSAEERVMRFTPPA